MKKNNKGIVAFSIIYPLAILFSAGLVGLVSMNKTRKIVLDKMKLNITDSIFDDSECSCDTILNKLNYIIKYGAGVKDETTDVNLHITNYDTKGDFPTIGNAKNDVAIVSMIDIENYYISETKPKDPVEGSVWLRLRQTSPNYIESATSRLPIASVEQYQEGKWVQVEAALFNGSVWKSLSYTEEDTASESTIAKGYTAIVNGKKITGQADPTATYFKLVAPSNSTEIRLRGRTVGFYYVQTDYEYTDGDKYTFGDYKYTLNLSWNNDAGQSVELTYCDEGKTTDTRKNGIGVLTEYDCYDEGIFQVSPTVVAIVYSYVKTVNTYSDSIVDSDEVVTTVYHLKTYKADATKITQVSDVKLNPNYETTRKREYYDSDSTHYDIYQNFDFEYDYQTFYNTLNDDNIYLYANEAEVYQKIYVRGEDKEDYNSVEIKNKVSPVYIKKSDGKAALSTNTVNEDGSTTYRQLSASAKYFWDTNLYEKATNFYATKQGMAIVTFNNTLHEIETSTSFQAIVGTSRVTWTATILNNEYFSYNLASDDAEMGLVEVTSPYNWKNDYTDKGMSFIDKMGGGLGFVGTFARYYWDYKKDYKNGIFILDNLSTSLNSNTFIGSTSINKKSKVEVDVNGLLPTASIYKGANCSYFTPTKSVYCNLNYNTGKVYIIFTVNETQNMNLELLPTSVSFRTTEDGTLLSAINDNSYSTLNTLVLETYR